VGLNMNLVNVQMKPVRVFGKGATVQQFQKQHPDVLYWGEFIVW
jgi:hypothetical protein